MTSHYTSLGTDSGGRVSLSNKLWAYGNGRYGRRRIFCHLFYGVWKVP